MADYRALIKDEKTQNWLKASIAINITKDGLSDFVNNVAGQLQHTILTDIRNNNHLHVSATCNTCKTGNAVQCPSTNRMRCPNSCTLHRDTSITYQACPNQICHNFTTELKIYHRYHQPSFKNTDSTKWCSSAWEIAKCYHPPDGYFDKADASVTDFNGVVSVIINCKEFDNHVTENLADKNNIFVQSRDVVKSIRHTGTLQVEDVELQDVFTAMRAILSDTKTLSGNTQAQEAMKTLSSIEADTLTITIEDVVKLIQEALDDTRTVISDASRVSEEAKHTNEETKELQSKLDVLNSKEEELKKLLEAITKAQDEAIKNVEHAGERVTKDTTEKLKIAGQMEESRLMKIRQTVKQDVEHTGELLTTAATEKIKSAGQVEESHVKETGQAVKQDVEHACEHVAKDVTEKLQIAGQMEDSRVKETGQTVKQDVEHAGEQVTKDATEKLKIVGQMEDRRVKEAGQTVKQDVKRMGEHVTMAAIEKIKNAGQMEESRVKETGKMVKQGEVEQVREKKTSMLGRLLGKIGLSTKKPTIYQELQQALAYHYWTEHYSMPLSPLLPEIDDKLTKFYIAPEMKKVDTKSSTQSVQTQDSVDTYKSLFYNGNNLHRNIYIQGEAGIGKSTFCTKLGLVWSEKYYPECSKKKSSVNKSTVKPKHRQVFSDESIIKEFDFVFSLALRNVQGECEIEKMIETEIINGLPNHTKYAGLVPKILDKERCLIILDGLDEWSHQSDVCRKAPHVPHRKSWTNTAVLTSTRPWKMNEVRLRDSEISKLIQVTGIADSQTFIKNVLNCLNDKYNTTLLVWNFITYMEDKQLIHFLNIPVVAMQLLWLWHSGHELGDSKCKIYINMMDMLFGRAEEKSPSPSDDTADIPKTVLLPCFKSTEFCEKHKMLLDCLSSLAFHTLYSNKREETLVFSESILKSHVKSTEALEAALTTGILSQHKSPSQNMRCSHFSFLHKTFQEFLAAYYIATHADESDNNVHTLFQVYGQTVDIMDISELFVFVCGLNTEMSSMISDSVMKSFSVKLTNYLFIELHSVKVITDNLQEMLLTGYKEGISNGHKDTQLALHHVHYGKYISDNDKIYRDRLVDRNIDKIVTLCAEDCTVDVNIQQIFTQSSSTLSYVWLCNVTGLTGVCLDLFTNITLKYLSLSYICTECDIKLNTSNLLYCVLGFCLNKEVEHSVLSALTEAPQLQTLVVFDCKNMSVLGQVLPTLPMLHTLDVRDKMLPASLCRALSTLSQLQVLTLGGDCEDPSLLCRALSTLSNLQYITLENTDLGDNGILLPNSIKKVYLDWVKLTGRFVRQLVDRLTQMPHQVICKLHSCTVSPEKELDTIVKHIQQSHMFEIQKYHTYGFGCNLISLDFTKIQT